MMPRLLIIALLTLFTIPMVGFTANNTSSSSQPSVEANKKPLYWVDPMEPDVHYKAPGKSRMGMELVPVYSKEKNQS